MEQARVEDDSDGSAQPTRWWGSDSALLDDEEARRRLLEAASRCIVRHGSARIRMGEVAEEAGVARSTLYRYFQKRDDLIIGLFLARIDAALEKVVARLDDPGDAARCIPELVLGPNSFIAGSPVNEALFSSGSRDMVVALELGSEPLIDASCRHFGPLLERWQAAGQIHADLDLRDTVRWIGLVTLTLLATPWRERPIAAKREFLDRYLVRALVVPRSD
jgi:TetR/AcrR family transcriptional regulator